MITTIWIKGEVIIENINPNKIDSGLGLIQNVPKDVLSKIGINYVDENNQGNLLEVIIISASSPEELNEIIGSLGGRYEDLGYGFGLVSLPRENLWKLANVQSIQYIELPKNLYTTDAASNRASCVTTSRDEYSISGEGILVGFIDSGIDYTHPAFRNDDGTTRIEFIYDISENGRIYAVSYTHLTLPTILLV